MMKRLKLFVLLAVFVSGLSFTTALAGGKKEKAEVTFLVSMTCEKCQHRIEDSLAFEKGVTGLDVDLQKKLVTIEYRTDKTTPEKLKEAIRGLGYTATVYHPRKQSQAKE